MLRFGLVRLVAAVVIGIAVPFGLYKLSRRVGLRLLLAFALTVGLAYGAVKADNLWNGDGLLGNLLLMATSAIAAAAYVGLSVGAAKAIANIRL